MTMSPMTRKLRLSGLSVAEVSRRSGVAYMKCWRYFQAEAELSGSELRLVERTLDKEIRNQEK